MTGGDEFWQALRAGDEVARAIMRERLNADIRRQEAEIMGEDDNRGNMETHELKTWSEVFQAVWDGLKTFEVRWNDRGFKAGDRLILREYDPTTQTYTGREVGSWVSYVLYGGAFGLPDGMCVMALDGRIRNIADNDRYFPLWADERHTGAEATP